MIHLVELTSTYCVLQLHTLLCLQFLVNTLLCHSKDIGREVWGAVCLKTNKEAMFTNEVDVYLPDRCLRSMFTYQVDVQRQIYAYQIDVSNQIDVQQPDLCRPDRCLETRSMFSNQVDVQQPGRCLETRSMFSKATRSHKAQILGRGFLWSLLTFWLVSILLSASLLYLWSRGRTDIAVYSSPRSIKFGYVSSRSKTQHQRREDTINLSSNQLIIATF